MMKRSFFTPSFFALQSSRLCHRRDREWKWLFVVKIHELMSDMYHNEREWEDDVRSISMCRRHALEINVPPVRCVVVRFERCLDVTQRAAAMMMWCDTKGYGSSGKRRLKFFVLTQFSLESICCYDVECVDGVEWQKDQRWDVNREWMTITNFTYPSERVEKIQKQKLWVIVLLPVNGGC